jgi:hypothetical protein
MDYRNIDTDLDLLVGAKRYYLGELSIDQLYWELQSEGYSEKEIDLAIHDYYLIYVRTNKVQNLFVFMGIFCLIIYLIFKVLV